MGVCHVCLEGHEASAHNHKQIQTSVRSVAFAPSSKTWDISRKVCLRRFCASITIRDSLFQNKPIESPRRFPPKFAQEDFKNLHVCVCVCVCVCLCARGARKCFINRPCMESVKTWKHHLHREITGRKKCSQKNINHTTCLMTEKSTPRFQYAM